jgi:Beta-galactosidase
MLSRIAILLFSCPFLSSAVIAGPSKQTASGIYDLLPGDTVEKPAKNLPGNPCWSNPNIAGVVLRGSWGKFEPAANQYDWSYLDTGVSLAQANNKKIAISVQAGVGSPEWLYDLGAKRFHVPGFGTMPLPWDPIFVKYWAPFVAALGARYDGISVVTYVTMGSVGRLEEAYLCTTLPCVHAFNAAGGVTSWTPAAESITDMYAAAFPNTPFLYAFGSPGAHPNSTSPFSEVTSYGVNKYPGRYGIKSDALKPGTSPRFWPSIQIPALSPTTAVGYQTVKPFNGEQALAEALKVGLTNKAHFIEVYEPDCENPHYQSTISDTNQQLLNSYR